MLASPGRSGAINLVPAQSARVITGAEARQRCRCGRSKTSAPHNPGEGVRLVREEEAQFIRVIRDCEALRPTHIAYVSAYVQPQKDGLQFGAILLPRDMVAAECYMIGRADSPVGALRALRAKLEAEQKKPVEEMTDAEKLEELARANYDMTDVTWLDNGRVSVRIERRSRLGFDNYEAESVSEALSLAVRDIREEEAS